MVKLVTIMLIAGESLENSWKTRFIYLGGRMKFVRGAVLEFELITLARRRDSRNRLKQHFLPAYVKNCVRVF